VDWFECLDPLLDEGCYVVVFTVLVLCGVGLPIPEEATFLLAGYAVAELYPAATTINIGGLGITTNWHLWFMILVGMMGIMVGDTLVYHLGKRYGLPIMKKWPFRLFIDDAKINKAQKIFAKHGSKAVFLSGFFAGFRLTVYFLSGTMRLGYARFMFWDLMRALLTCPISIWLGCVFGKDAEHIISNYRHWVLLGVIALACLFVISWLWQRWSKKQTGKNSGNAKHRR
jgi:membrane protein DedA with SNARE-associated domain